MVDASHGAQCVLWFRCCASFVVQVGWILFEPVDDVLCCDVGHVADHVRNTHQCSAIMNRNDLIQALVLGGHVGHFHLMKVWQKISLGTRQHMFAMTVGGNIVVHDERMMFAVWVVHKCSHRCL